jgi:signal transduction histidine kinase
MRQDRRHLQQQKRQADKLLAEAGSMLASSLDYGATLAAVAELAVRSLADFCVIDIFENGELRRVQVANADPARAELTAELMRFPIDRRRPHMSLAAIESGKSVLVAHVTEAELEAVSQSAEHRRIIEALTPRSFMAVPLLARERLLGVVLLVSSHRSYGPDDVELAERLVQFAALEVDNARLYEDARAALLARDRVLGIVAHDLRNPLNTITMSVQLLLNGVVPEAARERQLSVILRSAEWMNRLIQDLLDVTRIEANQLAIERTVEEPASIVAEAAEMNASVAGAKGITLTWTHGEALPVISCDRDRLLQVLTNLIGNGIKFTAVGGRIELSVERVGERVRFAVMDTGVGIRADDLPKLFQPFWQAHRDRLDGAGLGLTIARGIVEAHGGAIWAESAEGRGSTFYFTVPALMPEQGEILPPPADRRRGSPISA